MLKLIVKSFIKHWQIWLAVLPLFIVSGFVFSTILTILNAIKLVGPNTLSAEFDYGVFFEMPMFVGSLVILLLARNAMKQCIDLFDETNDILMLLGVSPRQLSVIMTGQMLLVGLLGALIGNLFAVKGAQAFINILPTVDRHALAQMPLQFSGQVVYVTLLLQAMLITITSLLYCLKNYQQRKGRLSATNQLDKQRHPGLFSGSVALLFCLVVTVMLYIKAVPNPTDVKAYTSSMASSMNLLLPVWLALLIGMNFLIRPLFKGIVKRIVDLPSITKQPMLRSAFDNMQYNVEGLIKLSRPVIVITLLVGNFIALFLNTKLLIDGHNSADYLYDLIFNLLFVFGAPIIISLANVLTSIGLFRLKTRTESAQYFFSGCPPNWLFKLKLIEIGTASLISVLITLFGTFLFAIPLLRVTYLGGGNIFKANWTVNCALTFGAFLLFFGCFILINGLALRTTKKYIE